MNHIERKNHLHIVQNTISTKRSGSGLRFSFLQDLTQALQMDLMDFLCNTNLHLHFSVLIPTSFLIPPYCLTVLLALRNLATLAMVSAAKALRSMTGESRIFTMLCRPPMSTIARRICTLWLIFLRIFRDPILKHTNNTCLHSVRHFEIIILFYRQQTIVSMPT